MAPCTATGGADARNDGARARRALARRLLSPDETRVETLDPADEVTEMRAHVLFRVFLAIVVAALFVMAGRSRGPATATASQPVAGLGQTAQR